MKAIELQCWKPGRISIVRAMDHEPNRTDESGALAVYQCTTPEALQNVVARYDVVYRPNMKEEPGKAYTLRKARNDFAALAGAPQ